MSRYFGIPLRNGLPLGLGAVATLRSGIAASGPANSATDWYFAALGLTGTPWADVSRTGLGTRVDSAGLVGYGPHNLAAPSADFSNANYSKILGVTVSGSPGSQAITFPGTTNAERIDFVSGLGATGQQVTATFTLRGSGLLRVSLYGSTSGSVETLITLTGTNTEYTVTSSALVGNASARLIWRTSDLPAPTGVVWSKLQFNAGGTAAYLVNTTTAARYLPRITHDPVTLSPLGLLVEGQATNFFGRTEDLSATYWTKRASTTITANAIVAPDGTTTADAINQITNGSGNGISQDGALWIVGRVAQFWVKAGAATSIIGQNGAGQQFTINTVTRAFESVNAAYSEPRVTPYPNGWLLCSIKNASGAGTDFFLGAAAGSGSGETFYVWGTQAAADASSYIPNPGTGTAVRVADWTGPGVALTGAALAAAFPGGVTGPFTGVIRYRKSYSVATDETLLALSAGSSAGGTNLFAVQTNGTQAKLTTSAGDGTATGTLVHDGSMLNRIAYSVDPTYVGPELVTNGTFPTNLTGWTVSKTVTATLPAWEAGGMRLISDGSGFSIADQELTTVAGVRYVFSINLTTTGSGSIDIRVGTTQGGFDVLASTTITAGGTSAYAFTATGTSSWIRIRTGSNNATGYLVDDVSVKTSGKMSLSVNGAAAVETTGIAYTGAGVAALIPGSQTYGGTEPMGAAIVDAWDNTRSTYITGAALQALTA